MTLSNKLKLEHHCGYYYLKLDLRQFSIKGIDFEMNCNEMSSVKTLNTLQGSPGVYEPYSPL